MNVRLNQLFALVFMLFNVVGCASNEKQIAVHLENADKYYQAGEYAKVEIELKNVLQIDASYVDAYSRLGEIYLKTNNPNAAFRAYSNAVNIDPGRLEDRMKLARFFILANRMEEARGHVEAILGKEPDHIGALYAKATLDEFDGDPEYAVETYKRIIELDAKQARAYAAIAKYNWKQGNRRDAKNFLRTALAKAPNDVSPRILLARLYMEEKDSARALEQIKQAQAMAPDDATLKIMEGNIHKASGQYNLAEKVFLDAIGIAPDKPASYLAAGRFYDGRKNRKQADQMYAKAVENAAGNIQVLLTVANRYYHLKAFDKAQGHIEQVLTINPDVVPARMLEAKILIGKRQWRAALTVLNRIQDMATETRDLQYFIGLCRYSLGEFEPAMNALSKAEKADPSGTRTLLLMAEIHIKQKAYLYAEKKCNEVLARQPNQYQALSILVKVYVATRRITDAESVARQLLQQDPGNPEGHYLSGIVQRHQQKETVALSSFEKAMQLNNRLLDVFSQIIAIYLGRDDFKGALDRCDRQLRSLAGSPYHKAFILNLKGQVYDRQKSFKEAAATYQAAITAYAGYMPPHYALAQLYMRKNHTDDAIAQIKVILELDPGQPRPLVMLGSVYDSLKQYDQSEKAYRKALSIDPEHAPAANNLAYLLAEQDRSLNEAFNLVRLAREKMRNAPSVRDTMGWVYFRKGMYNSAISEFKASLEKMPGNAMVHYHLGMAYLKNSDPKRARPAFEKALALNPKIKHADEIQKILESL